MDPLAAFLAGFLTAFFVIVGGLYLLIQLQEKHTVVKNFALKTNLTEKEARYLLNNLSKN